ncbi:hypothetical protein [Promicromonospora panici]|uniref:hypothetical protein n=1 Tax=Promicromonospora panici TaxID=2219658 RepID=UPI00101C4236|nr:hypothetical protein [Promicromonospora panici]
MSQRRISALDVARRYLFEAQDGLNKAARVLTQHGTASDGLKDVGRTASSLGRQVEEMKNRVRKAHEAALSAERGNGGNGRGGWGS